MKTLRDNIKIVFIIVIVGFLVSIFAGLGSYFFVANKDLAMVVNDEKVGREEFDYYFNNLMYQQQEAIKTDPTKTVNPAEIKQDALRAILQDKIFLQEAKKIGEKVSDNEIQSVLIQYPIFQINGQFDPNTYYKNLRYIIRKTPKQFEQLTGLNIKIDKTKFLILNSAKCSKNELLLEYETMHNMVPDLSKDEFDKKYFENKKMSSLNDWFRNIAGQSKTEVLLKD
jgi:peptidyl-prolyl cis-trans isomerase D